jgi:hypothetical protein
VSVTRSTAVSFKTAHTGSSFIKSWPLIHQSTPGNQSMAVHDPFHLENKSGKTFYGTFEIKPFCFYLIKFRALQFLRKPPQNFQNYILVPIILYLDP